MYYINIIKVKLQLKNKIGVIHEREKERERGHSISFSLLDYKNSTGTFVKTKRVIIVLFFDKLPHIQKSIFILKGIFFSLKLSKIIKYTSYHFCGFTPS